MVLPAGTTVPPLPHLLVLLAGLLGLGLLLRRTRPPVTEHLVVALAPWMVVGASLYVLYQVAPLPPALAPFASSPAVYGTTAVLAGGVWLLARRSGEATAPMLAAAGVALSVVTVTGTLVLGGVDRVLVPLGALLVGVLLGLAAWRLLLALRPAEAATEGRVGLLVLLAHAVDGVTTAAGVDLLGFGERTPAARVVMDLAAALPTAELLGVGWLFVAVKLLVAGAVVVLFAEYVRETPSRGYALLGLVAAVGLGPGVHNVLLFAVASA